MLLNVRDRSVLLGLLEGMEGSIVTLRTIRDLQQTLSLSDEERAKYGVVEIPGGLRWNTLAIVPTEVELSDVALGLLKDRLRALEKRQKLTLQHLSLYEQIVEGKVPDAPQAPSADGQREEAPTQN